MLFKDVITRLQQPSDGKIKMNSISARYLEEFVAAAHQVAQYGLVVCASGNLSWRINDSLMLITATDSWMENLSEDQIAVCRIADAASINGKKPSKEVGIHAAVLRESPDVNVLLHFQSPSATTIACRQPRVENFFVIPEIPYYIGSVGVVPYLTPGSPELAEAVTAAVKENGLAILCNHGQVAVAKDLDEVIVNARFFELACEIILKAGDDIQPLSQEAVANLRRAGEAARAKG